MHRYRIALLLLSLLQGSALACEPPAEYADGRHRAIGIGQVYIGRVVGLAAPELETGSFPEEQVVWNAVDKLVRVKVYETLAGAEQAVVEAWVNWCTDAGSGLGDVVAIFGRGKYWEITNKKDEIQQIRDSFYGRIPPN